MVGRGEKGGEFGPLLLNVPLQKEGKKKKTGAYIPLLLYFGLREEKKKKGGSTRPLLLQY